MYMIMGSKIKTGNKIRFCAVRLHSVTVLSQQCPVYVQFYNLFGLRDWLVLPKAMRRGYAWTTLPRKICSGTKTDPCRPQSIVSDALAITLWGRQDRCLITTLSGPWSSYKTVSITPSVSVVTRNRSEQEYLARVQDICELVSHGRSLSLLWGGAGLTWHSRSLRLKEANWSVCVSARYGVRDKSEKKGRELGFPDSWKMLSAILLPDPTSSHFCVHRGLKEAMWSDLRRRLCCILAAHP